MLYARARVSTDACPIYIRRLFALLAMRQTVGTPTAATVPERIVLCILGDWHKLTCIKDNGSKIHAMGKLAACEARTLDTKSNSLACNVVHDGNSCN